jgi:hypothetical protein
VTSKFRFSHCRRLCVCDADARRQRCVVHSLKHFRALFGFDIRRSTQTVSQPGDLFLRSFSRLQRQSVGKRQQLFSFNGRIRVIIIAAGMFCEGSGRRSGKFRFHSQSTDLTRLQSTELFLPLFGLAIYPIIENDHYGDR